MNFFNLFKRKPTVPVDVENHNYVCIPFDPIATMNDLREGNWDMDKVHASLGMGMLRYAKQSEVDKAIEVGRLGKGKE